MRDWYLNMDNIDSPVLFDTGKDDLEAFREIDKSGLTSVTKDPVTDKGTIIYEKVENEKITFKTTGIGSLTLSKYPISLIGKQSEPMVLILSRPRL